MFSTIARKNRWGRSASGAIAALLVCSGGTLANPGSDPEPTPTETEARIRALEAQLEAFHQELTELRAQRQTESEEADATLEAAKQAIAERDDLTDRVDELEDYVFDIDERLGSRPVVRAFDGLSLDIGGFITQSFTAAFGEDSSEASFNQTLFELLIAAQVNEDIDFFTALGFLREADLDVATDPRNPTFMDFANRTPQIISWANYRVSDQFEIRAGRFVTPHGIINIEHFPPVLLEINQPQFLRPFSGATLFPNFLIGVQAHGKFFVGEGGKDKLSYSAYAGMFAADPDGLITGGRVDYTFGNTGLTVGANYSFGHREADGTPPPPGSLSIVGNESLVTNDYHLIGADLLYDKGRILWKNEVFFTYEKDQDNRFAFYTQPAFRITNDGKWIAFYRFDYLDPGQELGDSLEHVVGLNFRARARVRVRAAAFFKHFETADELLPAFQLSATFSF